MSSKPPSIDRCATQSDAQSIDQSLKIDVAAQTLLQHQYQQITRRHLGELHQTLFSESTGLHFHIAWASLHPISEEPLSSTACSVCCQLSNTAPPPTCSACNRHQQELAQQAGKRGHRFTCGLGVSNYWFSVTVRDLVVGTAYVQALDKANLILRERLQRKSASAEARFLSRAEFDDAARLLRFIAQSAETAVLAELNQTDAAQARQTMNSLQHEKDRLNEHIHRLLPEEHQLFEPLHPAPSPLVHRMLELVHRHYAERITLQECARDLGRNAAYLSDLFAHAVGLPFKVYLTELRLEKSKELLVDPHMNINEVAQAVGYELGESHGQQQPTGWDSPTLRSHRRKARRHPRPRRQNQWPCIQD